MEAIKFSELPTADKMPLTDEDFFPIVASNENRRLSFGRLKNQLAEQTHTDTVSGEETEKVPTSSAVEERVKQAESKADALGTRVDGIDTRLQSAETKQGELETQQNEFETKQGEFAKKQSELEKQQGELDTKQGELETKVGGIDTRLQTAESGLATAQGELETQSGEIEELKSGLESAQGDIATQGGEIDKLQSDFEELSKQPGPEGPAGKDGTTPHIDEGGNWFIGEEDTGVKAQGERGADGQDGAKGTDGITPHIDEESGNWFLGEQNTGVKAQGSKGEDGTNGQNGEPGADGADALYPIVIFNQTYAVGDSKTLAYAPNVSRKPKVGETFVVPTEGGKALCMFKVTAQSGANFTYQCIGKQWLVGATGANGQNGENGADGKSAFDIAKEKNPDLADEEAWLASLKGADGKQGDKGADGADGVTPELTISASVDSTHLDTPTVSVQKTGEGAKQTFAFDFKGLMGAPGKDGASGGALELWGYNKDTSTWEQITGTFLSYTYYHFALKLSDSLVLFVGHPIAKIVSCTSSVWDFSLTGEFPTTFPSFIGRANDLSISCFPQGSYANSQNWASTKTIQDFISSVPCYLREGSSYGSNYVELHYNFENGTWGKGWASDTSKTLSSANITLNYQWLCSFTAAEE